jgi:modulator of FtsH protease HflK
MPWSNQGGGWQGGNGGSGGQGPWGGGKGPSSGRGGGGGAPPDLEEIIRKGQERLKAMFDGGGGGGGSGLPNRTIAIVAVVAVVALFAYNAFYQVEPNERGVVLTFGEFTHTTGPGLHMLWWPVQKVETVPVLNENQINFGEEQGENLILAGDQNIVDLRFTVLWKIRDPQDYLFNVRDQSELVKVVSESAMREIVGRTSAEEVRTRGRQEAQQAVQTLIQETLDSYEAGILINSVNLEKADPPPQVIDAFEEVQRAEQNQNRLIREAEQYRNKIVGEARGNAAKIVEDGRAYRARIVQEAQGEAERFNLVYASYAEAQDVTRQRIFLETIEDVFARSNKVIVENGQNGSGVVPYLPLTEIQKRIQQDRDPNVGAGQ